ncbi:glutamine--fructose-6-phosphate transaminase (isomerizing) [Candidatus Woesearchaeota archaeon]|nr:glutamine--fructose-6-phosphate transaminase (isomerizing) [Candidatus Woesearchaeota archaeon]|tara:strand:+ start:5854 stop:7608 length:1755 start_codon:yes stop_codon:yes gene_type:complete
MCGIIAYKGKKDASKVVLEGLKSLEYRGYDSWGIATVADSDIKVVKKVGKISDSTNISLASGNIGIGHTRWATHGSVTEDNTHPHLDCTGKIAVVHNGIIENYQGLRKQFSSHKFVSETDTEIIAHIIEDYMNQHIPFDCAVAEAVKFLKGRSAFVAVDSDSKKIVAVRKGTPLIVGVGEDEFFIASDITAFFNHTKKVQYLDDNELVVIDNDAEFFKAQGGKIEKRVVEIDWQPETAAKEGYKHYLIKEIMDQKDTLYRAINQDEEKIMSVASDINNAYGTFLVGCGTAGKVCMAGEYLFSKVAKKHVNAYVASEFPNYNHYLTPKSLIIAISQSGETADVLEAIEAAKKKSSKVISLLNVFGSTMMRNSDKYLMVNAGAERAVVSTKATTAQLAVITLLTYATVGKLQEGKLLLMDVAEGVNDMLNPRYEEYIKKLAEMLKDKNDMYIIGRSLNYPIALEAAIKLQETAYIHAEGFAGGELKHGPLALIDKGTPCIALVANDESKDEIISNAMEIKSRGGFIIGIAPENNEVFDYWIKVPDAGNASPIVNIIPVQILAYHIALLRNHDPDKPRNLAKSVTVK